MSWLLLQLADSAFPSGGFAHSGGLEAAAQAGELREGQTRGAVAVRGGPASRAAPESPAVPAPADAGAPTTSARDGVSYGVPTTSGNPYGVPGFLRDLIWQAAHGALPLASSAWERPEALGACDARADAFLVNHVANRASRQQGRALLQTCALAFPQAHALQERTRALHRHHAPLFGALLRSLAVGLEDAQRLLLFGTLRGAVSAAVRLALLGTHEAQALQARLAPTLEEALRACAGLREPQQTAPLADLLQATHDRLYSRLFLS